MLAAMRHGLGRRPGLVSLPRPLLEAALRATGRAEIYQRLAGSLVANPAALMALNWVPTVETREALAMLARDQPP